MSNKSPKISVLIPVYNYGHYLSKAVESVERQTCPDWEIIVVDDCSTNNSFEVEERLQSKLKGRLELIKNSANQGVSRSRNIAFEASRGEYIAFLDADDYWHPAKLEAQIKLFESMDTLHMVHTGIESFADSDTIEWLKNKFGSAISLNLLDSNFNDYFLRQFKACGGNYFDILCKDALICLSTVMIKRQTLSALGGFEEGLFYQFEDWLSWLKCSLFFQIRFLPDKLTYYRVHRQSYTVRTFIRRDHDWNITFGQLHDRCLAFARQKGLKLSYEQLQGKPKIRSLLKGIAGRGKRSLRAWCRGLQKRKSVPSKVSTIPLADLDLLILFVTGRCNLSCDRCFYKERLNSKDNISFRQIESIADSLRKLGTALLTGGEPFLRKDLDRIIRLFIKRCNVAINTNGFYPFHVKDVLESILSEKPPYGLTVYVSIDGFEAIHNKMRGNNLSFSNALDTLRILSSLGEKYEGLSIAVSTLIAPDNLNELADLAKELATGFHLNYHSFEIIRANQDATKSFMSQQTKLKQVYDDLLGVMHKYYPHAYMTDCERFREQYANVVNGRHWEFPCLAGKESVVVYPNGMLSACEMRPKEINLADFDYNLAAALRSKSMKQEIEQLSIDKCFCTHGCWLLISMFRHLERKYGTMNHRIVLFNLFKSLTIQNQFRLVKACLLEKMRRFFL